MFYLNDLLMGKYLIALFTRQRCYSIYSIANLIFLHTTEVILNLIF